MKNRSLLLLVLLFSTLIARASDTIKLNFIQQVELLNGLSLLDGTVKLDRDNNRVVIAYDFSGSTRIAIAHDITALKASFQNVQDAWKAYVKAAGISDETKETPEQKAEVLKIQNALVEISVTKLSADDLRLETNPIPPSVISSVRQILK